MPEFDATVEYRYLPDLPGYAFGSDGSVWTCLGWGGRRKSRLGTSWRPIKPVFHKRTRYQVVTICLPSGRHQQKTVHSLILSAFSGPPGEGQECRHKNNCRTDNRASNLEWGTRLENIHDKWRHGTMSRGETQPNAKITEADVREIRRLRAAGAVLRVIAAQFDLSLATTSKIARGLMWRHVA